MGPGLDRALGPMYLYEYIVFWTTCMWWYNTSNVYICISMYWYEDLNALSRFSYKGTEHKCKSTANATQVCVQREAADRKQVWMDLLNLEAREGEGGYLFSVSRAYISDPDLLSLGTKSWGKCRPYRNCTGRHSTLPWCTNLPCSTDCCNLRLMFISG